MWKGVSKPRPGKAMASLSSKVWNGVFISARQSMNVPSTPKSLGFRVPTEMNPVRVHLDNTEFRKGENMTEKVTRVIKRLVDTKVLPEEEVLKLKEIMSKEDLFQRPMSYERQMERSELTYDEANKYVHGVQSARPSIIPSIVGPLNSELRSSLLVEELGKGKVESQITSLLDAKVIPMEEKLLKLMKEFSKLEEELEKFEATDLETWGSDHEYGRKKMELLARVELLYNEAKSYELSVQSGWESFLVSVILPRFEFHLKKRSLCDPLDHPSQALENSDKFLELNRLREAFPIISEFQGSLTEFWKLTSFPVEYVLDEDNWVERKLKRLLASSLQEYPQDIEEVASVSPSPEAGKFFDVVELLSRFPGDLIRNDGNRSRVSLSRDTFKGKYVLICCFHVPVLPHLTFTLLVNLCNELYSTRKDFEMVVVARMNSLADDEEVFHHLFSGFPKSCLAVPFEDKIRRDYVCKVLGLSPIKIEDDVDPLILNAEGIVLPLSMFNAYGAAGFPFTDDITHKRELELKAMIFEKEGNWLERVLRINDSSPDYVYRFNPAGGPREEMSVSQFGKQHKNKHVGLYLCSDGEELDRIVRHHEECREKQLDFEVVVVYMPFLFQTDPKKLQDDIEVLMKGFNVCDWWCLPFNNSVSMRFLRLSNSFYPENLDRPPNCDKLVVVGPDVDHLDLYGILVMAYQGFDAHPLTVEAGIKLRVNELKEITLESIFKDGYGVSVFRGNDRSDSIELEQLIKGKKHIVLCIVCQHPRLVKFKALTSFYNHAKEVEKVDFEMVLVTRPGYPGHEKMIPCHDLPWYICPAKAVNSTKLEELIGLSDFPDDVLVGFGEDGRVCSCQSPRNQFFVGDTLYDDVQGLLTYYELHGHDMLHFAHPRSSANAIF